MKAWILRGLRAILDRLGNRVVGFAAFLRSRHILPRRRVGNSFTILLVPHDRAPMRRFRLRRPIVYSALVLIIFLSAAGILFPHFYLKASSQANALQELARENRGLLEARERFEERIGELRGQVQEFQVQAGKLALMAGLEDLPSGELAAGSPGRTGSSGRFSSSSLKDLEGELSVLGDQTEALRENYQVISHAFEKQSVLLGFTPSIKPVKGILGHGYGWRKDPFTGLRDFHPGVDIVANRGTKVYAPADGIVTKMGRTGGYGKVVFLSHGYGITTRYGHLESYAVKVGDKVKRGDLLGTVGSTGRSTGPHLHYEVLVHNQKVNPVHYIIEEFRRF